MVSTWRKRIDLMFKDYAPKWRNQLRKEKEYEKLLDEMAERAEETELDYLEWLTETQTPEKVYETENPTFQQRATQELMNETTARDMTAEGISQMLTQVEESL